MLNYQRILSMDLVFFLLQSVDQQNPTYNWLVAGWLVDLALWKMMEFVTWDDEISNIWKVIKAYKSHVPNHQPVTGAVRVHDTKSQMRCHVAAPFLIAMCAAHPLRSHKNATERSTLIDLMYIYYYYIIIIILLLLYYYYYYHHYHHHYYYMTWDYKAVSS